MKHCILSGLPSLGCAFFLSSASLLGARLCAAEPDFAAIKAAAGNGDAKSLYDLARCFELGQGTAQDYAQAASWMQKSADQHYAPAEAELGYFYGVGLGVAKDPVAALKWYQLAANHGNAVAQFAMGNFYSSGRGVPKDPDQALKWWRMAANQDNAQAQNALGQACFEKGQAGSTNREDYMEAATWLRKASEQGYTASMNNLGLLYDQGLGVTRDWKEAAKWYHEAAEHGDTMAEGNLGALYLDGRGVTNDLVQAYVWFKLNAFQGGVVAANIWLIFIKKNC